MNKVNCIKVIAPQRSGTNYMDELIRRNFDVPTCLDTVDPVLAAFMKHAPVSVYPEMPARIKKEGVGVILIRKPFDLWVDSVRRKPCGIQKDFPKLFHASGAYYKRSAVESFFNAWYRDWGLELEKNGVRYLGVNYLDLLTDLDTEMFYIQEFFGVGKTVDKWNNPSKVYASARFNQARLNYYLEKAKS